MSNNRNSLRSAAILFAWLAVALPEAAFAKQICNTVGQPLEVSATNLAFGTYSPGSPSPTDSNSTVKVYCANASRDLPSFAVALSAGDAGGFNPRNMINGSATLNYNMYIDSTYTTIWGDGTSGTSTQSYNQNQNQTSVTYTDYGQVPASQFVTAGSYADTITVTVTF